ncbi:AP2/ERF domain-containing protein [Artemisia annua]|uniref:AP2/ERF domain-containing protein n=1 Tax=Artemisia annua TaxID=35608 RepID=A0A2U1LNF3_ARTAN|nr:AP2/ERF domain-containing protein [Artemisia annua]
MGNQCSGISTVGANEKNPGSKKEHNLEVLIVRLCGADCKYSPLHSSVTAKLDEICQSLAVGKSIDGRKKSCKSTIKSKTAAEEGKVEGSESDICSGFSNSPQSSGLMFPELAVEERVWYDSENFSLEKCPPYEIDWGSI